MGWAGALAPARPPPPPARDALPREGLIPFPQPLYSYSWVVALLSAIVTYYVLSVLFPARERLSRPAGSGATS